MLDFINVVSTFLSEHYIAILVVLTIAIMCVLQILKRTDNGREFIGIVKVDIRESLYPLAVGILAGIMVFCALN